MKKHILIIVLFVIVYFCTGCQIKAVDNAVHIKTTEADKHIDISEPISDTGTLETEIYNISETKTLLHTNLQQEPLLIGYDDKIVFYFDVSDESEYTYYAYDLSNKTEKIIYYAEDLFMLACNEKYKNSIITA